MLQWGYRVEFNSSYRRGNFWFYCLIFHFCKTVLKATIWKLYLNERRQQNWWEPFGTYCWSGLYGRGNMFRWKIFFKEWRIFTILNISFIRIISFYSRYNCKLLFALLNEMIDWKVLNFPLLWCNPFPWLHSTLDEK